MLIIYFSEASFVIGRNKSVFFFGTCTTTTYLLLLYNQAARSTDMPLAFLRSSADPERLISHGAEYDAEIVRQVSQNGPPSPSRAPPSST